MSPYICGRWDGVNLWIQWDDKPRAGGYFLEVSVRPPSGDWDAHRVGGDDPLKEAWMVVPVWHEGWEAMARVRTAAGPWVQAEEVTFLRSRCPFEFWTARRPLHFQPGTEFMSIVDGAGCVYILQQEIELEPGQRAEVEMHAALSSGYCQLDHPGHFLLKPSLGVTIQNIAPSIDDVVGTGRDFTVLQRAPQEGPIRIIGTGEDFFSGAR